MRGLSLESGIVHCYRTDLAAMIFALSSRLCLLSFLWLDFSAIAVSHDNDEGLTPINRKTEKSSLRKLFNGYGRGKVQTSNTLYGFHHSVSSHNSLVANHRHYNKEPPKQVKGNVAYYKGKGKYKRKSKGYSAKGYIGQGKKVYKGTKGYYARKGSHVSKGAAGAKGNGGVDLFVDNLFGKRIPVNRRDTAALDFLNDQRGASGLLISFPSLDNDWSFTYDNALAGLAYISMLDLKSAEVILDALVSIDTEPEGGYLHRYSATSGQPVEGILRSGHNAYVLQAMNLYYERSGSPKYNQVALKLAEYILSRQDMSDGGIFGDPQAVLLPSTKSTDNNLAAYCALHNFARLLNGPIVSTRYDSSISRLRDFIIDELWDGTRFLRGKDDTETATDAQALGALIMGPMYRRGIYWVEHQTLTTQWYTPYKRVAGFDMDVGRESVWTEGTQQMTLAFASVGNNAKWDTYRTEAEKLQQSTGGFWQASNNGNAFEDTILPTEAVVATAWYIFAYNKDNVFELLN